MKSNPRWPDAVAAIVLLLVLYWCDKDILEPRAAVIAQYQATERRARRLLGQMKWRRLSEALRSSDPW